MKWLAFACALVCIASSARAATVTVDPSNVHQTWFGFGATFTPLELPAGPLRDQVLDDVFTQVGITTGNISPGLVEGYDAGWGPNGSTASNDDSDPFNYNWAAFDFGHLDDDMQNLVDLAQPLGFTDYYFGQMVTLRWADRWLEPIRSSDYNLYLDECAEHVLAPQLYLKSTYGVEPEYNQLFNEPTSGNTELDPGSAQEEVDIIKRVGQRLRSEGFANMKFVVPGEESEDVSLTNATAILNDATAAQYVGAIAFHTYPYGASYSYIPNILASSGVGTPTASRVQVRNQLRDLGIQHGVPVFMTEVSHGGVGSLTFDDLRGRAIHIHDELIYADAAAYYAMGAFQDTTQPWGDVNDGNDEGSVVYYDPTSGQVFISGMGYAIGHYARWVKRGAVRLEATSDDPLVQVSTFRDDALGRFTAVLINNHTSGSTAVAFQLGTLALQGALAGEQSTASAAWQALTPFAPTGASTFSVTLPAMSVTTVAGQLLGESTTGGPTSGSGTSTGTTGGATTGSTTGGMPCPDVSGGFTVSYSGASCLDVDPGAAACVVLAQQQCAFQITSDTFADGGGGISGAVQVAADGSISNATIDEGSLQRSGCTGTWDPGTRTLTVDCGGVGTSQSCVATFSYAGACGAGTATSGSGSGATTSTTGGSGSSTGGTTGAGTSSASGSTASGGSGSGAATASSSSGGTGAKASSGCGCGPSGSPLDLLALLGAALGLQVRTRRR